MSQLAPSGADYPGKTLGIVGLVLSFCFTLIGSVVSFVAWRRSRAAGYRNTPALVGIAIGVAVLTFWIIVLAVSTPLLVAART